jgi:hypothetical protein
MSREQPDYLSYLLRLWRVRSSGGPEKVIWRASLEHPHTRQRQGFASLENLFDFLRQQIGEEAGQNGDLIKSDT